MSIHFTPNEILGTYPETEREEVLFDLIDELTESLDAPHYAAMAIDFRTRGGWVQSSADDDNYDAGY